MTEYEQLRESIEEVIKTMFDREKSDAIFTSTLDDLDNLNTRDGKFEYSDYVTLHNDITALYDSFSYVDEIIQLLESRATKAESENKELRAELDKINAANVALRGVLEQAVADIEELLAQEDYLGVCWACANNNDCKSGNECVPKWRGVRDGKG